MWHLYYCLFYDTVSISHNVLSNDPWIVNWKGCGGKRSWLNLRYSPGICLLGLKKSTKYISKYSQYPCRNYKKEKYIYTREIYLRYYAISGYHSNQLCRLFILSRFRGLRMTYKMGFGLDDWIYWHLIHSTRYYRQLQRYRWSTHFTLHRYTRTRFLSLH
jgi:hypothetical protein